MADTLNTNDDLRAKWDAALQRLAEAEAAYKLYDETVWTPAHQREDAFERSHGLIPPGMNREGTYGYFEKRMALLQANPLFAIPKEVSEEVERLSEAVSDAQWELMRMEAPDLAALRWKLDNTLELEHTENEDGGNTPAWTARYVLQMIDDYRRLLPEAA